jgi:hypothetical protein
MISAIAQDNPHGRECLRYFLSSSVVWGAGSNNRGPQVIPPAGSNRMPLVRMTLIPEPNTVISIKGGNRESQVSAKKCFGGDPVATRR